jgi:hypothetical protein
MQLVSRNVAVAVAVDRATERPDAGYLPRTTLLDSGRASAVLGGGLRSSAIPDDVAGGHDRDAPPAFRSLMGT